MTGLGHDVSVVLGVLMALRAVGDVGLPTQSVFDRVTRILGGSTPVEVLQTVVVRVVIAVAAEQPLGARPNERLED
jgi:hypothetical protein